MLMCLHIDNEIEKLSDEDLLFILKISKTELSKTKRLFSKTFTEVDGWRLLKWKTRQFESDSPKLRVARHREKLKRYGNVTETLQERYGNGLDTDTDTDTEKNNSLSLVVEPKLVHFENGRERVTNFSKEFSDYLKAFEKYFPVIMPTDLKTAQMFLEFRGSQVLPSDIHAVLKLNAKRLANGSIGSPSYLQSQILNFTVRRLRGDVIEEELTLDQRNARNAAIALAMPDEDDIHA